MALIPIGSSVTTVSGSTTPIQVPVSAINLDSLTLLSGPAMISKDVVGSDIADSHWYRYANGTIRPNTVTDRVAIGCEWVDPIDALRVQGTVNFNAIRFNHVSVRIDRNGGEMRFSDIYNSKTLSQLVAGNNVSALDVPVSNDVQSIYDTTNVETTLLELQNTYLAAHTHPNTSLLNSLTDFTNSDLLSAIASIHAPITIATSNGLSIDNQALSLAFANTTTTGSLTYVDWNTFNDKQEASATLNTIKDLTLSGGSLIVGSTILPVGNAGQILAVNLTADGLEWSSSAGGSSSYFEVPSGYTSITNELGDINNDKYSDVLDLEAFTLNEILQQILFPVPLSPNFVFPTVSISVGGVTTTGNLIEKGTSYNTTLARTFTSLGNTEAPIAHAIETASRLFLNATVFTSPTSILYDSNKTFSVESDYDANPASTYQLPSGGTPITPDAFQGYPSSGRTVTATRALTVVDPIYYGCIEDSTSWSLSTASNIPWAKIITKNKTLVNSSGSYTLSIASYSGAAQADQWIIIAVPNTRTVTSIKYLQLSNTEVLNTFTPLTVLDSISEVTNRYTRADSTYATYTIWYTLNSYNNSETATYTVTIS